MDNPILMLWAHEGQPVSTGGVGWTLWICRDDPQNNICNFNPIKVDTLNDNTPSIRDQTLTNYKKFSDEKVFEARAALKQRFGADLFDFVDQFPLFACPQTMLRYLYIQSLLESVLGVPGDILEFGTWKGATAIYFAKMLDEYEPQSGRKVIVFDNFSGLPSPSQQDGKSAISQTGNYQGDLESLKFIIESFDLSHRVELIQGDANHTVQQYFKEKSYLLISLAFLISICMIRQLPLGTQ